MCFAGRLNSAGGREVVFLLTAGCHLLDQCTVLGSEQSGTPLLREGSRMGGLKSPHTNAYSQERKETHYKEAEVVHR